MNSMLITINNKLIQILEGEGIKPIKDTEKVVNAPNNTPTKTCKKCFELKSFLSNKNSIKTKKA